MFTGDCQRFLIINRLTSQKRRFGNVIVRIWNGDVENNCDGVICQEFFNSAKLCAIAIFFSFCLSAAQVKVCKRRQMDILILFGLGNILCGNISATYNTYICDFHCSHPF